MRHIDFDKLSKKYDDYCESIDAKNVFKPQPPEPKKKERKIRLCGFDFLHDRKLGFDWINEEK